MENGYVAGVKFCTPREFAEMTQLHIMTVYRLIKRRKIPYLKVGGSIRIPYERVLDDIQGVSQQ